MKRHTQSLLYVLTFAVALCSLLVQEAPDPMPSAPMLFLPLLP